jgi:hypothetical protein
MMANVMHKMNVFDLKRKFRAQRKNAKRRNIEWAMTFEEWFRIWRQSGKLDMRGRCGDDYCMCRKLDAGAYEVGNVQIKTVHTNLTEKKPSVHTPEFREALRRTNRKNKWFLGKVHSAETKKKMSDHHRGNGFLGMHHTQKTIELKRRTWKNQYGSAQDRHRGY